MKIVVCIRQGRDGEINPFDASAYEAALQISGAEVTILSMGPISVKDFLVRLTRLGAKKAILLSDPVFAGADTLATAYTLSLAIRKLQPDLIFCGRQTLIGDTAQTGPMLSVYAAVSLISGVMGIEKIGERVSCMTRDMGTQSAPLPALLTMERIHTLRLPGIRSKIGKVEIWNAASIGADPAKCGLQGSPTRVLKTFENQSGKRKCRFISFEELPTAIEEGRKKSRAQIRTATVSEAKLSKVCIVGEDPRAFAKTVSDDITVLPFADAETMAEKISKTELSAVLWGSDPLSKQLASQVSARLGLGLCADCTALETDGEQLIMYRPALSGSVIAKIVSLTKPAMATVRTMRQGGEIVVAAGYGVKEKVSQVKEFAERIGADFAVSRKMVDHGFAPYEYQVGLTGKTVSPSVYIAIGVSGAVHHIVGMQRSGTVIAVNPDPSAPIFDYADYGITETFRLS